jgi:predicted amidohydrolase
VRVAAVQQNHTDGNQLDRSAAGHALRAAAEDGAALAVLP